jgi:hypothetical protein
MSNRELHQALRGLLAKRMDALGADAGKKASAEQSHLEEGTTEREYWHHGYASALKDVLSILDDAGVLVN